MVPSPAVYDCSIDDVSAVLVGDANVFMSRVDKYTDLRYAPYYLSLLLRCLPHIFRKQQQGHLPAEPTTGGYEVEPTIFVRGRHAQVSVCSTIFVRFRV